MQSALAVCDATIPAPLLLSLVTQGTHGGGSSAAPTLAVQVLRDGSLTVQQHAFGRCAGLFCALGPSAANCVLLARHCM